MVHASAVEKKREGLRDGGDEHEENMGKTKTEGKRGGVSSLSLSAITYISARPEKDFRSKECSKYLSPFPSDLATSDPFFWSVLLNMVSMRTFPAGPSHYILSKSPVATSALRNCLRHRGPYILEVPVGVREEGKQEQGSAKRRSPGLVNFVPVLAYHFRLA